jgi:hypothetical protein
MNIYFEKERNLYITYIVFYGLLDVNIISNHFL